MEVGAGVAMTMLWSRWHATRLERAGHTITWGDYDAMVWSAFWTSGIPQIIWQEWLHMPLLDDEEME